MGDAAVDLALDEQRVDHRAAVVDDDVALHLDHRRFGIDFDEHGVDAAGGAAAIRTEVGGALETGLGARADRAAQRVGFRGELGQREAATVVIAHQHASAGQLELRSGHAQQLRGERQDLLGAPRGAAASQALPATTAPRLAKGAGPH